MRNHLVNPGLMGAMLILTVAWALMCYIYKSQTGRSLPRDLYRDIFGKTK